MSLVRQFGTQVLVPALIGVLTGAIVAGASLLAEEKALVALAALPGLFPAAPSLFALLLALLVVRYVTRATHPATSEVYIVAYHDAARPIVLRQLPGRVLAAVCSRPQRRSWAVARRGSSRRPH